MNTPRLCSDLIFLLKMSGHLNTSAPAPEE